MIPEAIFSDAGDILLDTRSSLSAQKAALLEILSAQGIQTEEEAYALFKPYKVLGQTKLSASDAANLFFKDLGIPLNHSDFKAIQSRIENERGLAAELYPEVSDTLKEIISSGSKFVIITDSPSTGSESIQRMRALIESQLRLQGSFVPKMFRIEDYVTGCISSKDTGVKKPHPLPMDEAMRRHSISSLEKCLYVGHKSSEIFGYARMGLHVVALHWEQETDHESIELEIARYNKRHASGEIPAAITPIKTFSKLSQLRIMPGGRLGYE